MDMRETVDVVVVGGGLAGLTAAAYLTRSGVAVVLFEQAEQLGGSAATQMRAGYAFNRGLHALYPGGAASAALRAAPSPVYLVLFLKRASNGFSHGGRARCQGLKAGDV